MTSELDTAKHDPVLLFGPQTLDFDLDSFNRLWNQLRDNSGIEWILEGLSSVLHVWEQLETDIPTFQYVDGKKLLQTLSEGLKTRSLPQSLFPLPNILLTPLVVVSHLVQYSALLKTTFPGHSDADPLPASLNSKASVLGLCTGILSAFVAACASTRSEIKQYGVVALRLAILIGALVDAEEASPVSGGNAVSLSVSHSGSQLGVGEVLKDYSEAYISALVDERRLTVTASERIAPRIVERLNSAGIRVSKVALRGRFHSRKHEGTVRSLIQFCNRLPKFQFPQVAQPMLKAWIRDLAGSTLHEIALKEVAVNTSDWIRTFGTLDAVLLEKTVICFGSERCVPPTIARKRNYQIVYVADIDLSISAPFMALFDQGSISSFDELPDDSIAVIGVACHVPGAEDLEGYWNLLATGVSQHKEIPPERFSVGTPWREFDQSRKWYGNFLENFDTFDHKFFKKSPREMASTDPQHRLVMKLAYQTVEQSGYFGAANLDKHIGCFIGIGNVDYNRNIACHSANAYSATGNLRSFSAGKVSHHFGWTGPSLTIDTACSSSSVAIHYACRSILNGECSSALAGGVNVLTGPDWFYNLAGAAFLSPTGQCRPFDAKGDGYCRGEGAGAVLLKKLSSAIADGNQVFGVIRSTRVYQNQNCTAITVPNAISLSDLFRDAVRQARLEPQAVSIVEAHGTGTPVGDPAEYDAIRKVFGGSIRSDILNVTSVKGLLGHAEFASGVLSLVKVILMINKGQIPPQASFTSINPVLGASPGDNMEISTKLKPWNVEFRACLINNYGASGSNASMVVSQPPKQFRQNQYEESIPSTSTTFPFWFSGQDNQSLRAYVVKFRQLLDNHQASSNAFSVPNLSFQLSRQSNRSLPQALIFGVDTYDELYQKLHSIEKSDDTLLSSKLLPPTRPVILCFGGQVSTYVGLDKDFFGANKVLKGHLDRCDSICLSLGLESIYPGIFQRIPIQDTVQLQTILFATQYSCASMWIDCGIKVTAIVGHSFGELTGLCIAGAYSLEQAIKLISGRARLIRDLWGDEKGTMLAAEGDLSEVSRLASAAGRGFSIACYNGPRSFTLAGPVAAGDAAEKLASNNPVFSGIRLKKLNVTNAFHCSLVDPLKNGLEALGQDILFNEASIHVEKATEYQSNRGLGTPFVANHMRNPVFFNHAIQRLYQKYPEAIWLEAGFNSAVTSMASRALGYPKSAHFQPVNITGDDSWRSLVNTTMKLWKEGLRISFWGHHTSQISQYTPIFLPPYQFEKSKHWMELKSPPKSDAPAPEIIRHIETPEGLTTRVDNENKINEYVRFIVNTTTHEFQQLASANVLGNIAAIAPSSLYMYIVLDALIGLKPEFEGGDYRPELLRTSLLTPLHADTADVVHLDATCNDTAGLAWSWSIKSAEVEHATGTALFRHCGDPELQESFKSLSRLSGRRRCLELLNASYADDILQGRNIYRAFEQVVNYKEPLRHVEKIFRRGNESAARVSAAHQRKCRDFNPAITEGFNQVASIYLNLMTNSTDLLESGIFVCEKIDRWLRNPGLDPAAFLPKSWDVFAVHHDVSDSMYISDIFAFDSRDGSLVEAILGVHHRLKVWEDVRLALSGQIESQPKPSVPVVPMPTYAPHQPPQSSRATVNGTAIRGPELLKVNGNAASQESSPDISDGTRKIICNLSGLAPDEIEDESDLVELGIDSLMAMEVVREVEATFKCTLQSDDLMELTDFNSLVSLIGTTLGLGAINETQAPTDNPALRANADDTYGNTTNGITHDNIYDRGAGLNGSSIYGHLSSAGSDVELEMSSVNDIFGAVRWDTDQFVQDGLLADYYDRVVPRSTELAVVYTITAFEQLGCSLQSAAPGQRLERISYLPQHQKFVNWIYNMLQNDARLIDINGSDITRTSVSLPSKSADILLQELLRDEPDHAAEHRLMALIGLKFADCLLGKEDGLQLIFGTPEGRDIATDMYANGPCNVSWIKQLVHFLEKVVGTLGEVGRTLRILEMGAGTGGTTSRILPLLARLGVQVEYTVTDISGSLVAASRKRFKHYPFVKFKVLDIESQPDPALLKSQHIILATNCIHATRDLSISLRNCHQMLRPDGFLLMLEMTMAEMPWVGFIFGLLEGWWLFNDGRHYVLSPVTHWERVLYSVGYGHVDWTEGESPESEIQRLIIAHATGPRFVRSTKPASSSSLSMPTQPSMADTAQRWEVVEGYISKFMPDFRAPSQSPTPLDNALQSGKCALVTGATGSLGSHIVANLAQLPDVHTVVCLNRISAIDATVRQHRAFELKGISLSPKSLAKLKVIGTDTSKPLLGLAPETYGYVLKNVSHIVHSAWPMSLTRSVRGYEVQFKILRNLINLAYDIKDSRPSRFRVGFQFISSSAVVANYPFLNGAPIPETPTTINSVPATGYADAKFACEHILEKTLRRYPESFHTMVVRIAQISGSTKSGFWNPTEYIPFLIKSSQVLRVLPDLDGTLSWYPVDGVASVLGELLMSETASELIYHIDNPSRQTWKDMMLTLCKALDLPHESIVPYHEWISRVRRFRSSQSDNPALQLIEFFQNYFIPMSCGGLILDTSKTKQHSKYLEAMGPVDEEVTMKYISSWKQSGFLHP
ncbi:citrinin polyketide synthase [Xylaria telfairii]|nr:citrinin polyketide synthase [Xylaria telfairii]